MLQHDGTTVLLSPMMYFNLIKNIIFPMFHEHKNTKLNHFNPIFKSENFRVLQHATRSCILFGQR